MRKFFRLSIIFFTVCLAGFLGFGTVEAEVLCCRRVKNSFVRESLANFINQQKSGIEEYFKSVDHLGSEVDIDSSIFVINPQELDHVRVRIPFRKNNKSIEGDISLEILVTGSERKEDIINFLSNDYGGMLGFRIITSSPGKGLGTMSKLLYCDIDKIKLVPTDEPTIVYISKTNSKNVYRAHALIQETREGSVLKKIYF